MLLTRFKYGKSPQKAWKVRHEQGEQLSQNFFCRFCLENCQKPAAKTVFQDKVVRVETNSEVGNQQNDFLQSVKYLMGDRTFLCLLMHGSVLYLITSGLAAFIPKYFQAQYTMGVQTAAVVAGGVSVPAAATGAIISGYLIKRLQLNCLGTIKMTVYTQGICVILCILFFFIRCPYNHIYTHEEVNKFEKDTKIAATSDEFCNGAELQTHCVNGLYNIFSPCILHCFQKVTFHYLIFDVLRNSYAIFYLRTETVHTTM